MKNLGLSLLMGLSVSMMAQTDNSVPTAVTTAFASRFPNVSKVKWEMEGDGVWEAEFKIKRVEYSASFNAAGEWMETEWEISKRELPEHIKKALNEKFEGCELEEAERFESPNGNGYEVEIELKNDEEFEVAISDEGVVLKSEPSSEEDED